MCDFVIYIGRVLQVVLNLLCFVHITHIILIIFLIQFVGWVLVIIHIIFATVSWILFADICFSFASFLYSVHLIFLNANFLSKFLNVFVGLVENFHKSLILLKVDQLKPIIKFVVSQKLSSLNIFLGFLFIDLLLPRLKGMFKNLSFPFSLCLLFAMELMEIFGMLQNFCQKLSMARFFTSLLSCPHILLKAVQSPCFFLILRESLRSLIKFSIN